MNCLVGIFLSEALTGLTMKHLGRGKVLDGDIDEFIESYLNMSKE